MLLLASMQVKELSSQLSPASTRVGPVFYSESSRSFDFSSVLWGACPLGSPWSVA